MHWARQTSPATVVMQDAPLARLARSNRAAQSARGNRPALTISRCARISLPPSKFGTEAGSGALWLRCPCGVEDREDPLARPRGGGGGRRAPQPPPPGGGPRR